MQQLLALCISTLNLSILAFAPVTIASTTAQNPKLNCNHAQTQLEINRCAQLSYQNADKKLNQVYQQVIPKLQKSRRQKLITAQQAWIKFRDASCEFESSDYEGGSIAPTIYFGCLEKVTQQRTQQLQEYLQPNR